MNKKQIVFGALLGLPTLALADVKFSIEPITIAANENATVVVNAELTDPTEMSGFEITLVLPEHFTLLSKNGKSFDEVFTSEQINTNYGWVLTRSVVSLANRTYKFVGFDKSGNKKLKWSDITEMIEAFSFDVHADEGYVPKKNDKIVLKDFVIADIDQADFTAVGKVNNDELQIKGDITGIYRLYGDTNNKVTIDDQQTEETIQITANENYNDNVTGLSKLVTVELKNSQNGPQFDDFGNLLWGDIEVRGLQGVIHLPKGIHIKGDGKLTTRTRNEDLTLGTPEPAKDGGETVTFSIYASSSPLRSCDVYGIELFQFEVVGGSVDEYNSNTCEIVIDNIIASKYQDSKRYTLDDVITITVENPNQDAKDDQDVTTGNLDTDLANAIANIDPWVKNSSAVLAQQKIAEDAVQALKDEIYNQYVNGVLQDWTDPDGLQATAEAEIAKLNDVAAETLEQAKAFDAEAQKWIDNADEADVPDFLNQYGQIVPIKDERSENAGSLKDAKEALKQALADAKTHGTLGDDLDDADVTDAEPGTALKDLEKAVQDQNAALEAAIKAAQEAKAAEDAKAQAAIAIEVPTLPGYDRMDDTIETYKAAKGVYDDALAALVAKFGTNGEDGTVGEAGQAADLDIYKAEIEAVEDAIDGLNTAIETVNGKAAANNQAAEDVVVDFALPTNVAADDTPETFTNAVKDLENAVKAAEEAGTQAKDDIYADEIQAVKDAQAAVIAKGDANNALVDDATDSYNAYDYKNDIEEGLAIEYGVVPEEVYNSVRNNDEVTTAVKAYEDAYQELLDKQLDAEVAGTQAKDDIYKAELEKFYEAQKALSDIIKEKVGVAADNETEAQEQLDKDFQKVFTDPENSTFDDVKESNNIPALTQAWEDAKTALEDAIAKAKEDGILGNTPNPLASAIQNVIDAREALEKAIEEAINAADELADIITDGMADDYTALIGDPDEIGELGKAKVANPMAVTNDIGKLPTTPAQYVDLINELTDLIYGEDALASKVMAVQQAFLKGEITLDQLRTFIDNTLPQAEQDVIKDAAEIIINYLKTVQRGDVGGDGRWTTNDYALLRKVILSEEYPTAVAIGENGEFNKELIEFDEEGNPLTESIYEFYRMDINQDGTINVGDGQAALNYTFYGNLLGDVPADARTSNGGNESLVASMNGNQIAIALNNSRQYSAFQMDVVLSEGMAIDSQSLAARNAGFSIETAQLANGATRILVMANEAGQAFDGNDGEVLFINVKGQGTVEFENVIFATINANTTTFQLNAVSGGATGINGVDALAEGEQVYSIGGRLMNTLKKGVNIIRRNDGTTQKVIKK
jgi:hypothetical protein